MLLSPEMQELVQSLSHTTACLARAERGEPLEVRRALGERARAIDAIRRWITAQPGAAQTVGAELAGQLARELETGRQVLLRLTLAREVMRCDRMALDRELQVLNGLRNLCAKPSGSLSCCG